MEGGFFWFLIGCGERIDRDGSEEAATSPLLGCGESDRQFLGKVKRKNDKSSTKNIKNIGAVGCCISIG